MPHQNTDGTRLKRLLFILISAHLWLPAVLSTEDQRGQGVVPVVGETKAGEYHLLVIGIDEYLHWPKLKTAVSDAEAVSKTLREEYGFDAGRTTMLLNGQATRQNIISSLRDLAKRL
jgi:hypothetical protein